MPRYRLKIEYDGAPFVGWQRQDNGPSVQSAIETAIRAFSGEAVNVFAAGRTDAGVHALAMTCHFDLDKAHPASVVRDAINHHLRPAPISVLAACIAEESFHARFSCIERRYEYKIINRRSPLALSAGRAWRISGRIDDIAMQEAAQALVGKHDFTTFRAVACQSKTPVKSLLSISITRNDDHIFIRCAAPSFLHHQVRSVAGSLVAVGKGQWPVAKMKQALEAKDRACCGEVAPAHGLYFVEAVYENK